ncbi:MAG: bile acid:sodium symporter family protein [Arenicella sp.]
MNSSLTMLTGLALIIIMWGMGLSLVLGDFKRVLKTPKVIAIGLVNQLFVLPVVAYLLLMVARVQPEIAVGVMLIAACPGGATSNLIAHVAKGDSALSISLTSLSSIITIFTIPFIVNFALVTFTPEGQQPILLDPIKTIAKIFVIIIIPVSFGMLIRHFFPGFAQKMAHPVKILSVVVIALVIVGILYEQRANLIGYFQEAGMVTLLLNIIVMVLAYISVTVFLDSARDALTVAIESGIQNGALAITLAVNLLHNSSYAVAPIIYSVIMFVTVAGFIAVLNKRLVSGKMA